ncbi:MAG: transcriptional activator [Litorilinea sp.]|nr:MAG: transcriptional activator [Litorilinea sp.]
MSRLFLRFCGPPEVWWGEQPVAFPTRKALALLVYLAVTGGWRSRAELMSLFWPESDSRRAQASLRNALARLRQALGPARSCVQAEADRLRFDETMAAQADWRVLAQAAETGDAVTLQQAVEEYRGDFLAGFSLADAPEFDEWAGLQREYWHRLCSDLLARLRQMQIDVGDFQSGLTTALRWTAHDPFNEAAHRGLMEAYALTGDRAAALRAYEACRALLQAELAIPPSPETEALAERIRLETPGPSPASAPPPSRPLIDRLPFTGRSVTHLQLVTAFHAARQGRPQVVLIEGEAGIGKSRLAEEFLAWAAAQGADTLAGRAFETGGSLPYQPVVDALRPRLERENAPDDLLSDVWLSELSRLLPELRERYPDLPPPPADPASAPTRLPEAVNRLGQALARRRPPLVLFLDDAQWADVASLDLLHYCSRAWAQAGAPVLLLLARRLDAVLAPAGNQTWLARLQEDAQVQRLTLTALTQAEARQLAQALVSPRGAAGREIANRLGDWLFGQTGGQPFFLHEMVNELVRRGALLHRPDLQAGWAVDLPGLERWLHEHGNEKVTPAGMRRLILSRLTRLSEEARSLLIAAAVLGGECSYGHLCQMAGLEEMAALAGLEDLLAAQLLVESVNQERPYRLRHDNFREILYAEASEARRRLLHRRALQALETAGAPPAELAYHAAAARQAAAAFRYSLAAGDEALALFAPRDAIRYYEQARSFLSDLPSPTHALAPLYFNLGRAYELAGDLAKAQTVYEELRQQAQTSGQRELLAGALNRLATVAMQALDVAQALDYLQQARALAEAEQNQARLAEAEWGLAQLYHYRFDFRQSLQHSQHTLELARSLGHGALAADALNTLAYAQMFLGQLQEGEATMAEARTLYARRGNQPLEADCLTAMAAAQLWQGRIQESLASARSAEAICAHIENPWGLIYSRVWLATALLDKGDYPNALVVAQSAWQHAGAHTLPPMALFSALVLARAYLALGQVEAGKQACRHAQRLNFALHASYQALIESGLCAVAAMAGAWQEAAGHARQALAHRRYDILPLVMPDRALETEALLRGGAVRLVQEDARRWGERVGQVPRFRVDHLRSLAVLAAWEGNLSRAIGCLQEALALAEAMGLPGEQWQIGAKLGALYRTLGQAELARQHLDRATAVAQILAAHLDDEDLRVGFLAWIRSALLTDLGAV